MHVAGQKSHQFWIPSDLRPSQWLPRASSRRKTMIVADRGSAPRGRPRDMRTSMKRAREGLPDGSELLAKLCAMVLLPSHYHFVGLSGGAIPSVARYNYEWRHFTAATIVYVRLRAWIAVRSLSLRARRHLQVTTKLHYGKRRCAECLEPGQGARSATLTHDPFGSRAL